MAMCDLSNISELVKKINHEGDPITFAKQSQFFAKLMSDSIQSDEDVLRIFQLLNQLALSNEDIAINLPHILTSRPMEDFRFSKSQTTIRNEILRILQGNFTNHQLYKDERAEKADNAITLLGECYNILRINTQPINIVGQSLLQLLGQELQDVLQRKATIRPALAKLVLTQVTLNGLLFKKYELEKLSFLLDTIRRVIVEADAKSIRGKAYLMLALDLYYNNFTTAAMVSLHKVYGAYLDESSSSSIFNDDQHVPEKRQRVEAGVQTEVAASDVFRAGPVIMSPVERATTYTNLSISREDSSRATPLSPSNSSGTRKSKIDPRIRNVKIGRVYPSPSSRNVSIAASVSTTSADGSGPEVGKLSIKNVTLHELAMMKENPSHLNRITNGYLDRLVPPSENVCPSIKSSSEYAGKENDQNERPESVTSGRENGRVNGGNGVASKRFSCGGGGVNRVTQKYQMEENTETIAFDPSYFDDYVPNHERAAAKSFLHFLENK